MTFRVETGLETLVSSQSRLLKGKKLGLLCNPASVDADYRHASHLINHIFKGQLTTLFSPQHGFYAEKQDNMIESDHFMEPTLNIPVYSLYAESRIPTEKMFENLDVLLVDIQDVGTRVYTFIYTVSYCMEMAAKLKKDVIILDRPNPIGGIQIEGNLLAQDWSSFVGRYEIPMRHGMTIGEICSFFNTHYEIGCNLSVIPMTGWKRHMYWQDTGLPWIAPSPNLPTPASAMVYPGQVIFEGTNVSEGRGTTQPFELFGAPYMDHETTTSHLGDTLSGFYLRPVGFEPTSGKWQNQNCRGFQIHITDRQAYSPYLVSLLCLQSIIKTHPDHFKFKAPPYEYEYERMPIDLILGSRQVRQAVEAQADLVDLARQWTDELNQFKHISERFYLYD